MQGDKKNIRHNIHSNWRFVSFSSFLLTALMVKIKLGAPLFFELANKMIWFINHKDRVEPMGKASREFSKEKSDVHKVNFDMLRIIRVTETGGRKKNENTIDF